MINSQSPTPEFEHCSLSPGRIVFACFIECLPQRATGGKRKNHNNLLTLIPFFSSNSIESEQRFAVAIVPYEAFHIEEKCARHIAADGEI